MDDRHDDPNDKVLVMERPSMSLRDLAAVPMGRPATPEPVQEPPPDDVPGPDKIIPLPRQGDPYKAYARPVREVPTLRLLLTSVPARGFSYVNLDTIDLLDGDEPGECPVIVLRFSGLTPVEIRIEGRNLDVLYDYLGYHRISWIRELPAKRDYKTAGEAVVTRITITPVQPAEG